LEITLDTNAGEAAVVAETADNPAPTKLTIGGSTMLLADAQKAVRGAGSWFWWIAALSLVNTLSVILDLKYGMALGLGITQVIDALFSLGEEGEPIAVSTTARIVHLAFVGLVCLGFYALGRAARNFSSRAFVWGMILYALDASIFALVGDWIGLGFHAFVLFMLWGGFNILRSARGQAPAAFAPGVAR
jgi:hypothetical protein